MFKKLCILLIFSKLKVTKLFNRQISYAQLSVHDIHYLKDVKVDYSNCRELDMSCIHRIGNILFHFMIHYLYISGTISNLSFYHNDCNKFGP